MLRREYFTSVVGSIVFAHFYALCERWITWEKLPGWMRNLPSIQGVNAYHYLFMFPLFLFIGGYPFLDDLILHLTPRELKKTFTLILGNVMLTALIEDAAYFYLYGEWIQEGYWTTKIIGATKILNIIIPNWYPILIFATSICYYYAFKKQKQKTKPKKEVEKVLTYINYVAEKRGG